MRAEDLDLRELLAFEPKGGILRLGGERVLLFDAVALGLLRLDRAACVAAPRAGEDVLALARVFLAATARRMGRKLTGFTPRAAAELGIGLANLKRRLEHYGEAPGAVLGSGAPMTLQAGGAGRASGVRRTCERAASTATGT